MVDKQLSITYSLSLISRAPVSKTGRCGFESQQIVPSSYMRNRVVGKNAEAQTSHLQVVLCGATRMGTVVCVDSKRTPINYHKRNTPMPVVCVPCYEKGWLLARVAKLANALDLKSNDIEYLVGSSPTFRTNTI